MRHTYALIIPALNEAENVGVLLRMVPDEVFSQIIVVDNGSVDSTATVASEAGAEIVYEARHGYGQACFSGIGKLQPSVTAVAFMDADLSDNPEDLSIMVRCFEEDRWDMVLGSRVLGKPEAGSLTAMQRFGNWLSTNLIALVWNVHFTDLGPLRILRRSALDRMNLADRTFGWNVEMQARAAQLRFRVFEMPVRYRRRQRGQSKISGTVFGSLRAGMRILWTIVRCWLLPLPYPSTDS